MTAITIYTSSLCGFCHRAKQLFVKKGIEFDEIDINLKPPAQDEMIKLSNGSTSVPQIFIGEEHIGGCDDLYMLEFDGELDERLKKAGVPISSE